MSAKRSRQACSGCGRIASTFISYTSQDPSTPIGDTLATLDELVQQGKVREIGCSNFDVGQLHEAHRAVRDGAARFVSVQNEFSLLHRNPEKGVLDACTELGLAFLPYFPLASGF
jgi:aryl-alcohol dehydrogenase-like predicted oxidoreductase